MLGAVARAGAGGLRTRTRTRSTGASTRCGCAPCRAARTRARACRAPSRAGAARRFSAAPSRALGQHDALARRARRPPVRQLDHHLVRRVNHRRRLKVLLIGELLRRRRDRPLHVNRHAERRGVGVDGLDDLEAARRQLELAAAAAAAGPAAAALLLELDHELHRARFVDIPDPMRERHEHRVHQLGEGAVGVVLGGEERVRLGVERREQVAERHVQRHVQHPVAAERPADRVRLRHVDRHARDLDRPDGGVDHRGAVPDGGDVDERGGEVDDARAQLRPHRLHRDLRLAARGSAARTRGARACGRATPRRACPPGTCAPARR